MRKLFIVLLIGCVIFDVCSIKTILFIVGGLMLFLLYGKLCYDDLSPEEKMMYESEQERKRRRRKNKRWFNYPYDPHKGPFGLPRGL